MSPGNNGIGAAPSSDVVSELLTRASSILTQEAGRLPTALLGGSKIAAADLPAGSGPESLIGLPQAPGSPMDPDRLRRQAHEIIESLLALLSPKGPPPGVPLLRCAAPVTPGHDGSATLRVANDEGSPSEVTLYCSNFVADSGYDIPSLRVTISPRKVTIAPKGEAAFEIKIAIPQQTPSGIYSGLIQATGATYVKAVLSVEVT
jgi:hypothetical protein